MVIELCAFRVSCPKHSRPMPIPQVDMLIHTLPYPIKRICFGA